MNTRWLFTHLLPVFLVVVVISGITIATVPSFKEKFTGLLEKFGPKADEITSGITNQCTTGDLVANLSVKVKNEKDADWSKDGEVSNQDENGNNLGSNTFVLQLNPGINKTCNFAGGSVNQASFMNAIQGLNKRGKDLCLSRTSYRVRNNQEAIDRLIADTNSACQCEKGGRLTNPQYPESSDAQIISCEGKTDKEIQEETKRTGINIVNAGRPSPGACACSDILAGYQSVDDFRDNKYSGPNFEKYEYVIRYFEKPSEEKPAKVFNSSDESLGDYFADYKYPHNFSDKNEYFEFLTEKSRLNSNPANLEKQVNFTKSGKYEITVFAHILNPDTGYTYIKGETVEVTVNNYQLSASADLETIEVYRDQTTEVDESQSTSETQDNQEATPPPQDTTTITIEYTDLQGEEKVPVVGAKLTLTKEELDSENKNSNLEVEFLTTDNQPLDISNPDNLKTNDFGKLTFKLRAKKEGTLELKFKDEEKGAESGEISIVIENNVVNLTVCPQQEDYKEIDLSQDKKTTVQATDGQIEDGRVLGKSVGDGSVCILSSSDNQKENKALNLNVMDSIDFSWSPSFKIKEEVIVTFLAPKGFYLEGRGGVSLVRKTERDTTEKQAWQTSVNKDTKLPLEFTGIPGTPKNDLISQLTDELKLINEEKTKNQIEIKEVEQALQDKIDQIDFIEKEYLNDELYQKLESQDLKFAQYQLEINDNNFIKALNAFQDRVEKSNGDYKKVMVEDINIFKDQINNFPKDYISLNKVIKVFDQTSYLTISKYKQEIQKAFEDFRTEKKGIEGLYSGIIQDVLNIMSNNPDSGYFNASETDRELADKKIINTTDKIRKFEEIYQKSQNYLDNVYLEYDENREKILALSEPLFNESNLIVESEIKNSHKIVKNKQTIGFYDASRPHLSLESISKSASMGMYNEIIKLDPHFWDDPWVYPGDKVKFKLSWKIKGPARNPLQMSVMVGLGEDIEGKTEIYIFSTKKSESQEISYKIPGAVSISITDLNASSYLADLDKVNPEEVSKTLLGEKYSLPLGIDFQGKITGPYDNPVPLVGVRFTDPNGIASSSIVDTDQDGFYHISFKKDLFFSKQNTEFKINVIFGDQQRSTVRSRFAIYNDKYDFNGDMAQFITMPIRVASPIGEVINQDINIGRGNDPRYPNNPEWSYPQKSNNYAEHSDNDFNIFGQTQLAAEVWYNLYQAQKISQNLDANILPVSLIFDSNDESSAGLYSNNVIHLLRPVMGFPDSRNGATEWHEFGHHVQNNSFPFNRVVSIGSHAGYLNDNTSDSLVEGWADYWESIINLFNEYPKNVNYDSKVPADQFLQDNYSMIRIVKADRNQLIQNKHFNNTPGYNLDRVFPVFLGCRGKDIDNEEKCQYEDTVTANLLWALNFGIDGEPNSIYNWMPESLSPVDFPSSTVYVINAATNTSEWVNQATHSTKEILDMMKRWKPKNLNELYQMVKINTRDSNAKNEWNMDNIDQLFALYGVFYDANGDWIFNKDEKNYVDNYNIGRAANGKQFNAKFFLYNELPELKSINIDKRPERKSPLIPGSYFRLLANENGTEKESQKYHLEIKYQPPFDKFDFQQDYIVKRDESFYLTLPESYYNTQTIISTDGSSDYLIIDNKDYWKIISSDLSFNYLAEKTFTVDNSSAPTVEEIIKKEEEKSAQVSTTPVVSQTPTVTTQQPTSTPTTSTNEPTTTPTTQPSLALVTTNQTTNQESPTSDNKMKAGETIDIKAENIKAKKIEVYLDNKKIAESPILTENFSFKVTPPANTSLGTHTIKLLTDTGQEVTTQIKVTENNLFNKTNGMIALLALLLIIIIYFLGHSLKNSYRLLWLTKI